MYRKEKKKMLSKEIYNRVLNYYDEYKKEYNKKNLIGIIPYECDDDMKK